jgi:hypothetical protein
MMHETEQQHNHNQHSHITSSFIICLFFSSLLTSFDFSSHYTIMNAPTTTATIMIPTDIVACTDAALTAPGVTADDAVDEDEEDTAPKGLAPPPDELAGINVPPPVDDVARGEAMLM